jgi:L-aminopeptidase/D-esterase-like protein
VRGAAVGAARGRNSRGTTGAGRGATSGLIPGGTSGASCQGATVPTVVSRIPTVKTVEPDSQRKSRSVGLGEAARGKLSSSKPHVERRSGGL